MFHKFHSRILQAQAVQTHQVVTQAHQQAARDCIDEVNQNGKDVKPIKEYLWDRCEYDCRICDEKFVTYPALQYHIKKAHEFKTATEYIRAYGEMTTQRRSHKCDICKSIIKCSKISVTRHLQSHGMSLDRYSKRLADKGHEGPTPKLVEGVQECPLPSCTYKGGDWAMRKEINSMSSKLIHNLYAWSHCHIMSVEDFLPFHMQTFDYHSHLY